MTFDRESHRQQQAMRIARAALMAALVAAEACGGGGESTSPPPAQLPQVSMVSGDGQHALVNRPLGEPIVVRVTRGGSPVSGASVMFAVTAGGGIVSAGQVTTDAAGLAATNWTLGATAGEQSLRITASSGGSSSAALIARATADALRLAILAPFDGNEQTAVAGTAVIVPPVVAVRDEAGTPMAGEEVHFEVMLGAGAIAGGSVVSDATGMARLATWTLGPIPGLNAVKASLVAEEMTATPIEFTAEGVSPGGIVSMPSRTYSVVVGAGGTLADTASGVEFRFPEGAIGELAVSRIVSGPPMPGDSSVAVRIAWSGTAPLQVVAHRTDEAWPQVFVWTAPVLTMEVPPDSQWMPLGTFDYQPGDAAFSIPSEIEMLVRPRSLRSSATVKEYFRAVVSWFGFTSGQKAYLNERMRDVANVIPGWIALIEDEALRQSVITLYGQHNVAIASGYLCPSFYTPVLPNPSIYLCVAPDRMVKSGFHEAGHYVTDLLLYNAGKSKSVLYLAPGMIDPSREHGFGDTWMGFRRTITEDYAFFSEYIGKGMVSDAYPIDGTDNGLLWAMTSNWTHRPASVDFPSKEGFGIAYIGALLRTNPAAVFFNHLNQDTDRIPLAGFRKEDIVRIFSNGPKNINEFNAEVIRQGPVAAVQVIAERIGWSYHGSGIVIDAVTQAAVPDVRVRPLIKVGEDWYETVTSAATGDDGGFMLDRIFPGAQVLRLYRDWEAGTDSVDVAIDVPWDRATTLPLEWVAGKNGTIVTSFPVHSKPKTFSLSESYDPVVLYGNQKIHAEVSTTIVAPENSQTRGTLSYLEFFRSPWNSDVPTRTSISGTPSIAATTWNNWEGGVPVRYTLEDMGCRAGRKPHSTDEVNLGASCSLTHDLAPGAEGQAYRIYVTYAYVRIELDEHGVPKPGTETRLQGERKIIEVYVW